MNIFATKDGNIYKVSMKNFIDATGIRAPYYKRTEIKGKVHESGYALCPGCGNPVHVVNLFNNTKKRKKKKAHTRHQRSSIKGLTSYNAAAYATCPYASKNTRAVKEFDRAEGFIGPFGDMMAETFGLSQESGDLLGKIYLLLKNHNPGGANQEFFALIASVSYYDDSLGNLFDEEKEFSLKDYIFGLLWNAVGDIKNDEQREKRLASLGITSEEINTLYNDLNNQHNHLEDSSQPFFGKPDLTHLSATVATILTDKNDKDIGGLIASSQSGTVSMDASAGYIGDLCIADNGEPSMNDGDYKSDLDAVNIAALINEKPNASALSIIGDYYNGIESGDINRVQLFKDNVGLETLKSQRNAYITHLKQTPSLNEQDIENRIVLFDKFIACIEQSKEEWSDE